MGRSGKERDGKELQSFQTIWPLPVACELRKCAGKNYISAYHPVDESSDTEQIGPLCDSNLGLPALLAFTIFKSCKCALTGRFWLHLPDDCGAGVLLWPERVQY